jgi:hypothetical protein
MEVTNIASSQREYPRGREKWALIKLAFRATESTEVSDSSLSKKIPTRISASPPWSARCAPYRGGDRLNASLLRIGRLSGKRRRDVL